MKCSRIPARSSPIPSTSPTRAMKQSSLAVVAPSSNFCQAAVRSLVTGPMISEFQLTHGCFFVLYAPLLRHHAANVALCHYIRSTLTTFIAQEQLPTSSVHFRNNFTLFSTHACWCVSNPGQCSVNRLASKETHHTFAECKPPRPTLIL